MNLSKFRTLLYFYSDSCCVFFLFGSLDTINVGCHAWKDWLRGKAYSSWSQCMLYMLHSFIFLIFIVHIKCISRVWKKCKKKLIWHVLVMFQILMFDSVRGRTCLHYAAYYGHVDCLNTILSAAHSSPVADSWLDFLSYTQCKSQTNIWY